MAALMEAGPVGDQVWRLVIVVGVVVWSWQGADRPVPPVTIAVLPFEHLGGPEREYLTDGLTEETSASLGQIDPEHLSREGSDIDQEV